MNDSRFSDSELVSLYQNGNEEAFETLLHRHKSRIFTAIYLIVKDQYVAEDLLQETFIKAINTIRGGRYNDEGRFFPWISRIAHNLAIDSYRRKKRYPEVVLQDGTRVLSSMNFVEESAEVKMMRKDAITKMRSCIKDLPEEQKEVLIMRHYLSMSFQEIADRTGVSINTALGRMRYALINMRKKMINYRAYDKDFYTNGPDKIYISGDYGGGDEGD